ncbi:MAG: hypothetical protein CMN76_14455 [Spirochaetaceae bacterium]|nr:hypothetical protein [Spirochaetaceae bacterium]
MAPWTVPDKKVRQPPGRGPVPESSGSQMGDCRLLQGQKCMTNGTPRNSTNPGPPRTDIATSRKTDANLFLRSVDDSGAPLSIDLTMDSGRKEF